MCLYESYSIYLSNPVGVADVGVASLDFFDCQIVGQMAGADDLDAVVKDEKSYTYYRVKSALFFPIQPPSFSPFQKLPC